MSQTATILDGKTTAQSVFDRCAARVKTIVEKTGVRPCLATVLVGEDPGSATYVKMKAKRCESVGMTSLRVEMPSTTTTVELLNKLRELGADPAVNGILLQHPVPKHIDERVAFEAIPAEKDVDGVTIASFGAVSFDLPGFGSCTPAGIMRLLAAYKVDLAGKHAVVIGRSAILGKPMAMMLLAANATVTICHSKTRDLPGLVAQADIVVAAADGVVDAIEIVEEKEVLGRQCRRVSIFLNVFDVHVNKAPIAGKIIYRQHHPGLYLDARNPECSKKNEALTWAIEGVKATLVIRQLTGAIARRIVPWSQVGDTVPKGFRFGMIRFGSRTEIYLPMSATVEVKIGDRVVGSSSVLARLH